MAEEDIVAEFPDSLRDMFSYVRGLHFKEEPDYVFLRTQMLDLLERSRTGDMSPPTLIRFDTIKRAQTVKYTRQRTLASVPIKKLNSCAVENIRPLEAFHKQKTLEVEVDFRLKLKKSNTLRSDTPCEEEPLIDPTGLHLKRRGV